MAAHNHLKPSTTSEYEFFSFRGSMLALASALCAFKQVGISSDAW
jgi:hypothetical protein